jgi:hypothetical protein
MKGVGPLLCCLRYASFQINAKDQAQLKNKRSIPIGTRAACKASCALFLLLAGCGSGSSDPPKSVAVQPSGQLSNATAPLTTPTYDGSGQAMHPGIVYFPGGWHGFNYWLVVTPYPNYDATKENPSILASTDNVSWVVPAGLTNPIAPGTGALADGDLFYDAVSDQLWVSYIDKSSSGGASVHLLRRVSSDGVTWGSPEDLFGAPYNALISPAVEKIGNTYYVWYVDASPAGSSATSSKVFYRTSADGRNWSPALPAAIDQPGYVIWHIDVLNVPARNELIMLAAAYPAGQASGNTSLFLATSPDGVNWSTFSKPILSPGSGWDSGQIYRSTLLYDSSSDRIRIWYSARSGNEWHTGYTQGNYTDLISWLTR